jgi:hypothetical protein
VNYGTAFKGGGKLPTPFQGWLRGMMWMMSILQEISMCKDIDGIDSLKHKGDLIFQPGLASLYRSVPAALIIYWIYERININGHTKCTDNYTNRWEYLTINDLKDKFWWLTINDIMFYIERFISSNQLIYEPTKSDDYPYNEILEGDFTMGNGAFWATPAL